jgi:hypothetical protein
LGRYLIDCDKDIEVSFQYDLEGFDGGDFLVRPVIKNGTVEVFNFNTNNWVGSYSLISEVPNLQQKMLIRMKGFDVDKSSQYFEIFNIKTGEISSTPEKEIWSKQIYSNYGELINSNLSKIKVLRLEKENVTDEYLDSVELEIHEEANFMDRIDNIPKIYILITGLVFFVTSFSAAIGIKLSRKSSKNLLDVKNRIYGVNGKIQ